MYRSTYISYNMQSKKNEHFPARNFRIIVDEVSVLHVYLTRMHTLSIVYIYIIILTFYNIQDYIKC